jgi:hypothetical protein
MLSLTWGGHRATASMTGDDAVFFRIDAVETLELVKDPDAPARA